MTTLTKTFDQRIAIQILAINEDVQRWHFELNGHNYQYFMSGLMVLFSLVVWLGKSSAMAGDLAESIRVVWLLAVIVVVSLAWGFWRR